MSLHLDTPPPGENSPERDLRSRLMWFYILFAGLMLVTAVFVARLMTNRLKTEADQAALRLAYTYAAQVDTAVPATLDATITLFVLTAEGEMVTAVNAPPTPNTLNWRIWQSNVWRQIRAGGAGTFTSTDPDGQSWLFAFAPSPSGTQMAMTQESTAVAYAPVRTLNQMWIVALIMFIIGGVFSWELLSRQVIRPLEQLREYSGLIRWRGRMQAEEKKQLDALAQRTDQIGDLARSLMAMEDDINNRFLQLSTLLETSRVVASSLATKDVLNNILDQVQNLFEVECCAIVALNKRADVFRVRVSRGLSEAYVAQLRIAPSEPNSPSMRALRNQEPIQVSNIETDLAFAPFRPRARAEGYQSVLAVPLQTVHSPPAVLLLYKSNPYRYSFTELELATSFAHHASLALENAALFARTDEQLQEQTRRLEAIVESLEDGLILEGIDGRVLYCNHQASNWLRLSRLEARQQTGAALFERILHTSPHPDIARQQYKTAVAGHGERTFDLVQQDNGHGRDLRIHLFDVTDNDGEMLGRGQLWQDISQDKELDRMKSALLSTVSHELRTPLATIKGYASTLLASDVKWDAAAQREFLQTISDETDRLTTLVKNLLDMSRIEAGLLHIQREVYSLNDLIVEVIGGFDRALNGRIQSHLAPDLPPAPMDIPHIGAVIRNLVENAAKYSPAEQPIELATAVQVDAIEFTVRDYGPGIPPALQEKIFDRFFRADNRLTRQVGGTGLGLAICKGFVEAHHGRVWVQSARPGTIFGFALPLSPPPTD